LERFYDLVTLRTVFNNMVCPQGWSLPLRMNLACGGELCTLKGMLSPLFTPKSEHSILFRRMEGRTENFTPRG
jgi:hypothetical protein